MGSSYLDTSVLARCRRRNPAGNLWLSEATDAEARVAALATSPFAGMGWLTLQQGRLSGGVREDISFLFPWRSGIFTADLDFGPDQIHNMCMFRGRIEELHLTSAVADHEEAQIILGLWIAQGLKITIHHNAGQVPIGNMSVHFKEAD